MLDPLTHLVLVYQICGGLREKLIQAVSLYIYLYPGFGHELSEEEWGEFYLSFQQRVESLIDSFEFRGYSFRTYLNRTLYWHLRTFRRCRKKERYQEWVKERESVLVYSISREEGSPSTDLVEKLNCLLVSGGLNNRRKQALKLRLLFLIMKNVEYIREQEFLDGVVFLGRPAEEAVRLRIGLQNSLEERQKRRSHLMEKRNSCYYYVTYYERTLKDLIDPEKRRELDSLIGVYRKRLNKLSGQIRRIPLYPTNWDISRELEIPKGSVDSGLYYLKEYLKDFSRNRIGDLRFGQT